MQPPITDVFYLAPMRGLTDATFRTVLGEIAGGFDLSIAPFVKTISGGLKQSTLSDLTPARNQVLPVIPQLLTRHPKDFVEGTKALAELGYKEVNWNLGCPYSTVTKKGMGAGLLKNPDGVAAFLDHVCTQCSVAISIKTRLGLDNPGQLMELLPVLNNYPLKSLTVHPRTATQMYEGPIQSQAFLECLANTKHRVVYSGEIWTLNDYQRLSKKFPSVHDWMIGRGAIADPFIAASIKSDSPIDSSLYQTFHRELYLRYKERLSGPGHLLARMQSLWPYLGETLRVSKQLLKKIKKARSIDAYDQLISQVFKEL